MPQRSPAQAPVDSAAADWHEQQAHQYVPGYYTGGRFPPQLRQPRPGRFGGVLLALGSLAAIMIVVALAASAYAVGEVSVGGFRIPGLLALLMIASGYSLLRKR